MTTARPAKARNEGQWALGHREPLNANEELKKAGNPLDVRERIENIYAKQGFDSIDKTDLRGRFRWWGLYTQREQGYDGTWTGDDNIDKLEAKYFMMRVRCDGGALSAAALRTLGQISTEFARDTADISDRQNVQYHWIEVENVPEIWRRLDDVGLQTTEACGDCPRVVLGSPLAGESLDEVLDPTWAIEEIVRRYIGKPDFADLPRKYKTAISGLQDVAHEINDVAFIGVNHPEHGPGLDLWVGGGLSTNPMLAQRVGAWVPLGEVPEVWAAVTSVFRDYGYRRLRAKARLKFLIKDWGIAKFREVLETEYLKRPLIDGPAPEPVKHPIDHVGVQRLKNGLNAVGVAPIAGRVSGTILTAVADLMARAGSDRIRFTPYQKLVILDIPDALLDDLIAGLDALGLQSRPSHWRRNLMACSGIEFCKLSFAETRVRAQHLVPELERRLEDINSQLDVPITVNINGCPNSCARIQIADIGFKGQMIDDGHGGSVEGFQVHLGGHLGLDAGFGRKLRQHKVTSDELGDYIDRVVRNFVKHRSEGERFAQWVIRAEEDDLR
ncbi:ferredoxin-dependent nitrite reductase [Mycobacterium tuberculosis]|uniref:Sulfite reductase [ferredoxin] n=17 Tax=Mycobacterium tuberculosis complex TaxID=77643 RepID=SIR_MYCTU|nr:MULTISPECIES: sulfite reductase SirA [Mycobacterium]P9WJ02.1 RecName: Full=Sulfite reductase [ferredoxin] [Mycobacterium tuberculosis CDC1551]P9WJ03.1 RecName: Full=Sulfite reductase [ferredoxin] [Mycobacterium tuberculosis H37Rv]Q7TYP6.2 RecName: Full=Sulfite reductase [ferredoxin] [Mycobacterium tuberculosis variant bovis AF2122/97]AHM08136.1 Ferredoxin--sulfite reductase, actinobacterial type [Mycobacterium tuberculosis variant bovis BCG str. ATCC 35743]EAY60597.1 ferredoxin-dependent ni